MIMDIDIENIVTVLGFQNCEGKIDFGRHMKESRNQFYKAEFSNSF